MITLQNLVFPEYEICTETELYFRTSGMIAASFEKRNFHFSPGGKLSFDTYFNALSIGKWSRLCKLGKLFLRLAGTGRFQLRVHCAYLNRSWEVLYNDVVSLEPEAPLSVELDRSDERWRNGILYFELTALSEGTLESAAFITDTQPLRDIKLAISITTFKREAQVEETSRRLRDYLAGHPYSGDIGVFVVDNGKSAKIETDNQIRYIENPNFGGSGGFARGLLEAKNAGYTHCLFMDDDASFHMENLHRTYAFLQLATKENTAIAGAMIANNHKWRMWENGALFDRICRPRFKGSDLRLFNSIIEIERETQNTDPATLYGGWWFFAFPIGLTRHYPFPFFVRGDDISFSLNNEFSIQTINGVISFQDDFEEKESPQTLYLDLRNSLVQHMSAPQLKSNRFYVILIPLWFILRNICKLHYETVDSLLLSWEDVLEGPDYFKNNLTHSNRRKSINDLVQQERWKQREGRPTAVYEYPRVLPLWRARLMKLTLNGHFLPRLGLSLREGTVGVHDRNHLPILWGLKKIRVISSDGSQAYSVQFQQLRGIKQAIKVATLSLRFLLGYKKLREAYKTAYPQITSEQFWETSIRSDCQP
ncbi:glycosyltransferase [Nitratireductor kimnyeongensis]|uniref:Glycosyltransferase n=1 Tax=Nitratireductor kimnyeongensis TaxID=430679 RepID=A0ABW0T738_9HYPH|nr:glycosyltransferase [Nitratireductor kimnyeongensis]QZZ34734.1 glycosyltransferase [Nitratireductor kimnyeongensis]